MLLFAAATLPVLAAAQDPPASARLEHGARVQIDHSTFDGVNTRTGQAASATWLRRVDASARWRLNPRWRLAAGLTHDDGELVVDTAVVSWRPAAGLTWHAGRVDADFGLDNTSSSNWSVGIERSAIWDLAPGVGDVGQGWGLRADGHGPGWHASAGFYDQLDATALVGRAVWMARPAAARVWQFGSSLAHRQGFSNNGRLRSRLGLRGVTEDAAGRRSELALEVATPARYVGDTTMALEAAAQQGPWLLQAEALHRRLKASAGAPGRSVAGQTLQLAWSPSKQPRRHDERAARFGRPEGDGLATGRWELFYRFDLLQGSNGLDAQVHTLGASWFLGRQWRGSVNAVGNRSDDPNLAGERNGRGWALRAQAVF